MSRILLLIAVIMTATLSHAEAEPVQPAGTPVATAATNAGDWRYTVRPGEDLSQIAARLLRADRSADDLLRHNSLGGSQVNAGDALHIPVQWLRQQPEPATVASVVGDAFVKRHLQRHFTRLREGTLLNVGDELRTDEGQVIVALADNSRIHVNSRSTLIFNRLTQYGRTGMADTRMRLERGRINTRVQPVEDNRSRFEIETPSAVAAVRGTAFRMSVREDGTRLEVTDGRVWFGDGKVQQMIPAGYGAWQRRGGALTTSPLAPAPQITATERETDSLPLQLTWEHADNARQYEMNLINVDTQEWLFSRQVHRDAVELNHLNNGSYRLELAAVDHQGMIGQPATVNFTVALQALAAQLLTPESGSVLNDDMPAFRWRFQGDSELARVEVARDADFKDIIATSNWAPDNDAIVSDPLPPGEYYWRVVTRAGGSSEAESAAHRFTVSGTLPQTRVINVNAVGDQVRVFWQTVAMSDGYRLQLARDAEFRDIVEEKTVYETSANLRLEPETTYHVRIRGRTDGPLSSEWGPSYELSLE